LERRLDVGFGVGSSEISLPHVGLEETLTWLFGSFLAANGLDAIAEHLN